MGSNFENFRQEIGKIKKREIAILMFAVIVVYQIAVGYLNGSDNSSSGSSYTTGEVATNWTPEGFDIWETDVAYKWVDNPKCDYMSVCAAIQVVTNKECSNNLYAELILQDNDYVQYDYTNDSQGSLSRGSTAELTFNFPPDERFAHFKLSKISCH
ncbi:hypothetical protein MCEMZLE14_00460 [Candidatus Nanopelagicaceae bacterium]